MKPLPYLLPWVRVLLLIHGSGTRGVGGNKAARRERPVSLMSRF